MIELPGDRKRYPFIPIIIGDDIVVQKAIATFCGGPNDPGDNGIGASGFSTKAHPDFLGCSLPMQGWRVCPGSPIPHLPWMTKVEVHYGEKSVIAQLYDVGPSPRPLGNGDIDLAPAVFAALGIALGTGKKAWRPVEGTIPVSFRIIGGAHFVS